MIILKYFNIGFSWITRAVLEIIKWSIITIINVVDLIASVIAAIVIGEQAILESLVEMIDDVIKWVAENEEQV